MRIQILLCSALLASLAAAAQPAPAPGVPLTFFRASPLLDPTVEVEGAVFERLEWNEDPAAFAGDVPGSLTALYDATLPPARIGWPLPRPWTESDDFVAAAVFEIDPQDYYADPFGYFQISWGLWNSRSTGFERTGTPESFAGDTFELIELDYFPNVSPFFGGPFLSPSVFGEADRDSPLFPFLGSFANLGFGSVPAELPLGEPLLAVLEHRARDGVLVASVHRVTASGSTVPVPGALAVAALDSMPLRRYAVDRVGLTLWRDGFGGPTPSVRATLRFHAIGARGGRPLLPSELSDAFALAN